MRLAKNASFPPPLWPAGPRHEFLIYDYRRGKLHCFHRDGGPGLTQRQAEEDGAFESKALGMRFGLDEDGDLWVIRPDGRPFETRRELLKRAESLAAKLRELGIDPDSL